MRKTFVVCAVVAAVVPFIPIAAQSQNSLFRVVLLGTGTPNPSPERLGPGTLIEAGVEKLIFDVGRGVVVRLEQRGIPYAAITGIFLTLWFSKNSIRRFIATLPVDRSAVKGDDTAIRRRVNSVTKIAAAPVLIRCPNDREGRAIAHDQSQRRAATEAPQAIPEEETSASSGCSALVSMVQTSYLRKRDDPASLWSLHWPRHRRILLQREMRSASVIVGDE